MTIRTTQTSVTFTRPFVLSGLEGEQPAGVYAIETDEERLDGLSFPAYRRVQTLIHLHPKTGNPSLIQTMMIDPEALAAALQRDQAPAAMLVVQDGGQTTAVEASRKDADRDALERGEGEGMIVRQQRQWTRGASVSERARPKADRHDDQDQ